MPYHKEVDINKIRVATRDLSTRLGLPDNAREFAEEVVVMLPKYGMDITRKPPQTVALAAAYTANTYFNGKNLDTEFMQVGSVDNLKQIKELSKEIDLTLEIKNK